MLRKRQLSALQKQNSPEKVEKELTDANQAQAKHELIMIDDDEEDGTKKQIPKKLSSRRKVSQTLLKPLMPKITKGVKKKGVVQKLKNGEREKNDMQRRTPRRAAATAAKSYIEVDESDEPKKATKTNKKVVPNKGMYESMSSNNPSYSS